MSEKMPKEWGCPACNSVIGHVVYGELYIDEKRTINTDGPNLIVQCPSCGYRKTWYAEDRLDKLIREIARETANLILNKIQNEKRFS
jgi:rubredoxin